MAAAVMASPERLSRLFGHQIATLFVSVRDISLRLSLPSTDARPSIRSSSDLVAYVRLRIGYRSVEEAIAVYLDGRNAILGSETVGLGSVGTAPIYPREIVRRALELGAISLILVHNHPSGDTTPSPGDIDVTRKLVRAAATLDVTVADHIIISACGWTSMRAEGLL